MLRILMPWDSQPQETAEVDRSNPLGAKLRYASTLGPNVLDVTSGRLATINNGPLTQVGPKGLFRDFVPASSQFLTLPTTNIVSGYPLTVSAWIRFDNLSTTGFIAYSLIGSTYGAIFGQSATAANTLQFNTGSAPGFDGFSAATAGIVAGGWNHYVLVHRSGSVAAFLNGKSVTITNVGSNYGEPAAGNQAIGQRLNGASPRYFDGGIQDFYVFEGELTAAQALSLYQDHYQVFAPRSIWVPVSVGGGGSATDLTVQDATHSHTADSPTLTVTTSTSLTIADATHAHTADSPALTLDTTLAIDEALHAHTADSPTVSTTGAVTLVIDDATHAHTADSLALTLDTTLAVAEALHAHTADNLTISASGAVNLTVDDATHAHTADSPTLTLGYVDLVIAEALHGHLADSLTLSVVEYTALVIARAMHGHLADNVTLSDSSAQVLGSLAGSTRKPGAIRSNVQTAARSNRQTATR